MVDTDGVDADVVGTDGVGTDGVDADGPTPRRRAATLALAGAG